jgi:hypothetical protein
VVEFEADAVALFVAAQAAAHCGSDLSFAVFGGGWQADYYLLAGIVPVVADGADATAGKVDHVDLIDYVPFMRVEAYAPHVHMDRGPRMTPSFYTFFRRFEHISVLLSRPVLICIGLLRRSVK